MATYNNLELEHYYLVREKEDADIVLVQPLLETGKCLLILHIDEVEMTFWRKKDEDVFEIIEELTEEQVAEYEGLFEDDDDDDDDMETWDMEEEDYEFEDEDEETGEAKKRLREEEEEL